MAGPDFQVRPSLRARGAIEYKKIYRNNVRFSWFSERSKNKEGE
jgi:hypothetical protein